MKNRVLKILIPYYVLLLINSVICIFDTNTFDFINLVKGILFFPSFKMSVFKMAHTWYMPYIIICYLITPLISKFFEISEKRNFSKLLSLAFVMFAVTVACEILSLIPFYGNLSSVQINIYIGAFYISRFKKCNYNINSDIICFVSGGIIALLMRIIKFFNIDFLTALAELYFEGAISYMLFGILLFVLDKINLSKLHKFLKITDKYSFYVYLTHYWFTKMGSYNIFENGLNVFSVLIYFALIILASYCFSLIIEKVFYRIFFKLQKRG